MNSKTDLRFSISLTFYHSTSKRFFGSTVMGQQVRGEAFCCSTQNQHMMNPSRQPGTMWLANHPLRSPQLASRTHEQVEGPSMKELLKKGEDTNAEQPANAAPAPVLINVTHDEILYWYSRVADQECMALLELVASEVEPRYGVVMNQYACGWTMLRPFGNQSMKVRGVAGFVGSHRMR
jgi:hypothetical protein